MGETKQEIRETVKVIASFDGPKIKIHFFNWRFRIYRVESVNLFHIERNQDKKFYHFAVSSRGNSYELVFDPASLNWELRDVIEN